MVAEGKGRIWRRRDGEYFTYLQSTWRKTAPSLSKHKHPSKSKSKIDPKGRKLLITAITHKISQQT